MDMKLNMSNLIGAIISAIVAWIVLKFVVKVDDEEALGGALMVLLGGILAPMLGEIVGKQLKIKPLTKA